MGVHLKITVERVIKYVISFKKVIKDINIKTFRKIKRTFQFKSNQREHNWKLRNLY